MKKHMVLMTGMEGLIGKNLLPILNRRTDIEKVIIKKGEDIKLYADEISRCDIIIHLDTLYKSDNADDFNKRNVVNTIDLIKNIDTRNKSIIFLSTTQAGNGTYYGDSKLEAENVIKSKFVDSGKYYILHVANEFGKWCEPNQNSVVATFCHNLLNNIDIIVNDEKHILKLQYVDDIVKKIIDIIDNKVKTGYIKDIKPYYISVGNLAEKLEEFRNDRNSKNLPYFKEEIDKYLYSTFVSYFSEDELSIELLSHKDNRGSFTELFHLNNEGQMSVNITSPSITKGNHWHKTKIEKFITVVGKGEIKLRKIGTKDIVVYKFSDENIVVITVLPGYTHNLRNTGDIDLVTIIWSNEIFNEKNADTYYEEV